MILHVSIEDKSYPIEVPEVLLHEAQDFFARMNADMDQGWQMGRYWVEAPDRQDRCRIVAEKLHGAIEGHNTQLVQLMGAYILHTLPNTLGIRFAAGAEVQDIELING